MRFLGIAGATLQAAHACCVDSVTTATPGPLVLSACHPALPAAGGAAQVFSGARGDPQPQQGARRWRLCREGHAGVQRQQQGPWPWSAARLSAASSSTQVVLDMRRERPADPQAAEACTPSCIPTNSPAGSCAHFLSEQDDELLGHHIPKGSWIIVHVQVGGAVPQNVSVWVDGHSVVVWRGGWAGARPAAPRRLPRQLRPPHLGPFVHPTLLLPTPHRHLPFASQSPPLSPLQGIHHQYKEPLAFRPERFMPGGEYEQFPEDIRPYYVRRGRLCC